MTANALLLRRLLLFFLPFLLSALYLFVLWGTLVPAVATIVIGAMVTYLVSPAGTEIVIPVSVFWVRSLGADGVAVGFAVASVVLVDVFTALFMMWNFDLAERTPVLGKFIEKTEAKCRKVIERKQWGENATLAVLVTYVALPVQMSGGVVGSVLGRLLGMKPRPVFGAICLGSALGAIPIGLFSAVIPLSDLQGFVGWVQSWTWTQAAGVAVLLAFVAAILYLYFRGRSNGGKE